LSVIRHVAIHGRVQGVGYRAFVEDEAARLDLEGWVRNRRDGATVEAVFSGSARAVADMIERCRKGPVGARVVGIEERDGTALELALRGRGLRFAVLPTQ
jgi:acylphosphatase